MNPLSVDPFHLFTEAYKKGQFLQALQTIITHPDVHYDSLSSSEPAFPFLINYADSCVFKEINSTIEANQALQSVIESDRTLAETEGEFLALLKLEHTMFKKSNFFPPFFQKTWQQKLQLIENWLIFSNAKPQLAQALGGNDCVFWQPWQPFSYPLSPKPTIVNPEGEIPVLFLEPLAHDFAPFLFKYAGPMILVFETATLFWQLLQTEHLIPLFLDPQCSIYIMEMHPKNQFQVQNVNFDKTFKFVLSSENKALQEVLPLLADAFGKKDKEDILYKITQRLLFRRQAEKYGKGRCFALDRQQVVKNWNDRHKIFIPQNVNLGPLPHDFMGEKLAEYKSTQKRLPYVPKPKIRIAHIAPQLVDKGHAPTQLLKTLLLNSSQDKFELFVISSECFTKFFLEYPITFQFSASTNDRAPESIDLLEKKGIRVFVIEPSLTYEGSGRHVVEMLTQLNIDVAIFHGPDQISDICGSLSNVPLRILFEHGTIPIYPAFDVAILSTEEALKANQAALEQIGIKSYALLFPVDARKGWSATPFSKTELGFPPLSFIMTTISNHLQTRLSDEMCHAIGRILQRSPEAYYAPIGNMPHTERFYEIFSQYGVSNRVKFLGKRDVPSQFARSMELYLNEFPFGSCLGMLDAIAAGCPVVSMHDANGPPQAMYGAAFMGLDHVVLSGKVDDYVELACRLIEDKKMYKEWSQHAVSEYEKRIDIKNYMNRFETIIVDALKKEKNNA